MEPNTIEDLEIQKLFDEDELLDKEIETIDINELTTANAAVAVANAVVVANEIEKEANAAVAVEAVEENAANEIAIEAVEANATVAIVANAAVVANEIEKEANVAVAVEANEIEKEANAAVAVEEAIVDKVAVEEAAVANEIAIEAVEANVANEIAIAAEELADDIIKIQDRQAEKQMQLDLLLEIINKINFKVSNINDIANITFDRDFLKQKSIQDKIIDFIPKLRKCYNSGYLTGLHSNAKEKQKNLGINILRQILKCNYLNMKPKVISHGYDKASGKKLVSRIYIIQKMMY